jgi:hypothetical protein
MRRVLTLAALSLATAGPASAATPIASLSANVPVSAHAGWVVWSVQANGRWELVAWHRGVVRKLPIRPRPQPFDVDLGTDSRGRTVATFSRCAQTPAAPPYSGWTEPWTGSGCHIRVLDLATVRERAARIPRPAGTSDTTPSMWRGRIAFGRLDPRRHHDVMQVLMWSPRTRRVTSLRHGGVPSSCPYRTGCRGQVFRGAVQGLDLGARLVTFLWWVEAPAVYGHGGWEVRADRLRDGTTMLAGAGVAGEACTGGADLVASTPPQADGDALWFSRRTSVCYHDTTVLIRADSRTGRRRSAPLPAQTLQLARDGRTLYALVAPPPPDEVAPTCGAPGAPCVLERLPTPRLTDREPRPEPPY